MGKKDKKSNRMKVASDNVKMNLDNDMLTITVDLSKDFGPSGSGKTIIIASTLGNKKIKDSDPEATIGLNIYKYPEK